MIPADVLPHLEGARFTAVLCMLAVNSYTDMRRRETAGRDRHYIAVAAAGCLMFLVMEGGWRDMLAVFSMVAGITITLALWRSRAVASGDCIILLAVSVMLPSYGGIYFVPVLVALLSVTAVAFLVPAYNLMLNVQQVLMPRGGPPLFAAYPGAGALKRAACVLVAHRKRSWEKHVIPVSDDGRGSFSIRNTVPFNQGEWAVVEEGRLVMIGAPVIPFFLAVLVLVAAALQYVDV